MMPLTLDQSPECTIEALLDRYCYVAGEKANLRDECAELTSERDRALLALSVARQILSREALKACFIESEQRAYERLEVAWTEIDEAAKRKAMPTRRAGH